MGCRTKLDYAGKDVSIISSGSIVPDHVTAFAADEVVAGLLTFDNVGKCPQCPEDDPVAFSGEIVEIKLVETLSGAGSLQLIPLDLLLFTGSFTAPTQHTAYPPTSIVGLDPTTYVGRFSLSGYEQFDDTSAAIVLRGEPMEVPAMYYSLSLYGLLIAQGAGTYTEESSTLETILTIVKH